jgi:hypothetical protein
MKGTQEIIEWEDEEVAVVGIKVSFVLYAFASGASKMGLRLSISPLRLSR